MLLQYTIIVIILLLIINETTDNFTTFVSILIAITFLFLIKIDKNEKKEHYLDVNPTSLDKILSLLGSQNSSKEINNKITDEDLSKIVSGLTIYYTSFSTKSYPRNAKIWYNISPYFDASNPEKSNCLETIKEDTHALFSQNTSYSRENGFTIGSTNIIGPKSYQLGISGNSSFTIITTIRFNAFDTNKKNNKTFDILTIPANTNNNIGLNLFFNKLVTQVGNMYGTNITLLYGTQTVNAEDPVNNNKLIMINPNFIYFIALVKNNLDISLYLYPNIDNISTSPQNSSKIIKSWKIDPSEDVLFSNKELLVNRNKNIHGNIFNFGIYNKALDENTLSTIFLHTQAEIHKTNQVLSNLAYQINQLQNEVTKAKACPYNETVCKACKSVNDWTNLSNIITSGSSECHKLIDEYCTNNVKNNLCMCWDNTNSISQTQECKNYVNIFKKLKIDDIETIKEKNNLCPCTDNKNNDLLLLSEISTEKHLVSPIQIIDDNYTINQDDIKEYENYVVNFYDDLDRNIG